MGVQIAPFRIADAEAHCAGEDDLIVRWLTGGYADVEGTVAYFTDLQHRIDAGLRRRPFGIWLDGRLCGFIEYDPDNSDGIGPDDVSLSYSVHAWARGRGVAVEAVRLICALLRTEGIGRRAAIRVEPENHRSVRVAEKAGFVHVRDFVSTTDTDAAGTPVTMSLYVQDL